MKTIIHPNYHVTYHEFSERPLSDSCWSTHTGPDGRIYVACCTEHTGGESVTVVRYRESDDSLEYLFDMDKVTGDLRDSGRATQCKIHYSFAPDAERGLLYCATHLSGPPKGDKYYNPWGAWHDAIKAFKGAFLVAYDTARDQVQDVHLMIPREGCRCLCFDPERRRLYAVTYPRDHFVWYDLDARELHDVGRLGSVNTQCLFSDAAGRVYTFMDSGRMVRFDPECERLDELPWSYPHADCQSPWHGVLYDAVQDPAREAVYMVPWKSRPHLARFYPDDGPDGRLEDLGPLTDQPDRYQAVGVNQDHVGGLIFGLDGKLHYVKSEVVHEDGTVQLRGVVCRMDPVTLEHERLCTVQGGNGASHYVARAAADSRGNFYMGKILARPAGFYRIRIDQPQAKNPPPLRLWG
ncbi:MAG: hypothetical protein K9N51_11735 [Candidatus Pacebacteria bacterium]|nr:hypothetical protein [Candidatus Paceibacterota bacterium]